ncbi:hypothetical protein ISS09_03655 [Candidatus Woesearchaeota archaeon]|nr:hypothetical protein [Candidatus Woesearchaeota archaeon]
MKKLLVFAFVFLLSISFAASFTACDGTKWDDGADGTGVFDCDDICFGACVAIITCEFFGPPPCTGAFDFATYDDNCFQQAAVSCKDGYHIESCVCEDLISAPEFPSKVVVFLLVLVIGLLVSFKAPISRAVHRKK